MQYVAIQALKIALYSSYSYLSHLQQATGVCHGCPNISNHQEKYYVVATYIDHKSYGNMDCKLRSLFCSEYYVGTH